LLIECKDAGNVIAIWSLEVLFLRDVDDGHTEMIKSFTGYRFTYTNILIDDIGWDTYARMRIAATHF
jgi:hypothetical protein